MTLAERIAGAEAAELYDQVTVTVPVEQWVAAHELARDEGFSFFDFLTGVDEAPGVSLTSHVFAPDRREHLFLRTVLAEGELRVPTLTGVFRGAAWHERETFEMFGVVFDGHPQLVPLLLPDGFDGHPLRKSFVLAARAVKAWPGAKEPGESAHDSDRAPSRRANVPPGVPDADSGWPRGIPLETKQTH